jgi:hypothetical protein
MKLYVTKILPLFPFCDFLFFSKCRGSFGLVCKVGAKISPISFSVLNFGNPEIF